MIQVGYVYDSTIYYRARYYDPTIGRFTSEDPIGFQGGVNFYGYVHNDAVNLIDPSGLCDKKLSARQCAADIANHWSIAGLLPGAPGLQNTFWGGFINGLLGNTVAGWSDLYDSVTGQNDNGLSNNLGGQLGGNASQGIPLPGKVPAGAKGPVGVIIDYLPQSAQGVAKILGTGKLPLDALIYAYAYNYCVTGKY